MALIPAPRILSAGDAAVTVQFGETIDPLIHDRVLAFTEAVDRSAFPGVLETVPTYRSATVYFDPLVVDSDELIARLSSLAHAPQAHPRTAKARTVDIPIVYGGEAGPDLADVAAFAKVSIEEAIRLHTSREYRVYMLGFSPGFAYLGEVPDAIAMPRLPTPRARVPAGSVGIAGRQTGIYPIDSPGGWRLIGRTPRCLYDPTRPEPFLLAPGDCVRFVRMEGTV